MACNNLERKLRTKHFVYMDETPGAAGGGEPAVVTPTAGTAPATEPASVLATAAPAVTEIFPDKFKVQKEDGTLDMEASARKMGESLQHLEKRMGSGDAPPKTAEEYTVTVPDEWKDAFPADSETMAAFRKDAHEQGLSQKQFDFFISKYVEQAPSLVAGGAKASYEQAEAELKATWKTDAEFKTQTGNAFKAWSAFADPADSGKMDEIGNSPAVVRLLARIGSEMKEGAGIPASADATGTDDIKTMLTSEANTNPKHPDHSATRAKIDAFYAKKYGTSSVV